jgi:drug/metabolite transporter (DMT)-like permease
MASAMSLASASSTRRSVPHDEPVTARGAPPSGLVARPSGATVFLLAVAVLGVSAAAPLIAAIAAPALAIALWRNVFGVAALWPVLLLRRRGELRVLRGRSLGLTVAAGIALAAHFGTWVPSVTLTQVASATALVATQPAWNAILVRLQGEYVPRRTWLGIVVAFIGVLTLTGVDVTVSREALVGDVLALIGGAFGAIYLALGDVARRQLSVLAYSTVCYSVCAVVLLLTCLVGGVALSGYSASAWWMLIALTVSAQLIGHTLFNLIITRIGPMVLSLAILLEVPGAAVIAAVWLGQVPPLAAIPAAVLILVGLALVVTARPPAVAVPD